MPTTTDLLTALRAHLAGLGLVRIPPAAGAAPPMVLEPLQIPAPGELEGVADDGLIISALPGGDFPAGEGEGWLLRTTIDLRYRAHDSRRIHALDAQIVASLHEGPGIRRHDWVMGGTYVLETGLYGGLTRLGAAPGQGFDYVTKLYLEARR